MGKTFNIDNKILLFGGFVILLLVIYNYISTYNIEGMYTFIDPPIAKGGTGLKTIPESLKSSNVTHESLTECKTELHNICSRSTQNDFEETLDSTVANDFLKCIRREGDDGEVENFKLQFRIDLPAEYESLKQWSFDPDVLKTCITEGECTNQYLSISGLNGLTYTDYCNKNTENLFSYNDDSPKNCTENHFKIGDYYPESLSEIKKIEDALDRNSTSPDKASIKYTLHTYCTEATKDTEDNVQRKSECEETSNAAGEKLNEWFEPQTHMCDDDTPAWYIDANNYPDTYKSLRPELNEGSNVMVSNLNSCKGEGCTKFMKRGVLQKVQGSSSSSIVGLTAASGASEKNLLNGTWSPKLPFLDGCPLIPPPCTGSDDCVYNPPFSSPTLEMDFITFLLESLGEAILLESLREAILLESLGGAAISALDFQRFMPQSGITPGGFDQFFHWWEAYDSKLEPNPLLDEAKIIRLVEYLNMDINTGDSGVMEVVMEEMLAGAAPGPNGEVTFQQFFAWWEMNIVPLSHLENIAKCVGVKEEDLNSVEATQARLRLSPAPLTGRNVIATDYLLGLTAEEISKRYDDDNLPLTEGLIKRTYIRLITNVNERSEERKIYYKEYMDNGELGSDIKNTQEKNVFICNGSCTSGACNDDVINPPDYEAYTDEGQWNTDAHNWIRGLTLEEAGKKIALGESQNHHCRPSTGRAGYGKCLEEIRRGPWCRGPDEVKWEAHSGYKGDFRLFDILIETPRNVTVSPDL